MKQLARSTLKVCAVTALRYVGVFRLFRWLNRNRLVILTYHGVLPARAGLASYEARNVVDEEAFSWQMRYLAKHYRCVPLEEAVQRLVDGQPLPKYTVAVTFDDGFQNNLRYAFPILRWRGIPATVFVTTGHIGQGTKLLWTERVGRMLAKASVPQTIMLPGDPEPLTLSLSTPEDREEARRIAMKWLKAMPSHRRDHVIQHLREQLHTEEPARPGPTELNPERYTFLTWTEVRALAQRGISIGSHTVHHPILSSLDDDGLITEVVESKREIEQHLNAPCTLFSYPNGTPADFDERDKEILQRSEYKAAVAQIPGLNDQQTDPFALRRLNIGRGHTPQMFIAQVSGFWPWLKASWATVQGLREGSPQTTPGVKPTEPGGGMQRVTA